MQPQATATYVTVIALFVGACGGNASGGSDGETDAGTRGGGSGGTNAAGSTAGGTGGTGGAVGTASSGGGQPGTVGHAAIGSVTTGTTGSGGGPSDRCLLPIVAGKCDAYVPSYTYNAETGSCESFVYGGCDGNDNRFGSLDAGLEACGPGGLTACEDTSECVIDMGCCGICGEPSLENLRAVHHAYSSANSPECQLVDCAFCEPEGLEQFGARCRAGQCEVYDVRQSELSECTSDDDCRLRLGLGCCERCSGSGWVAVSTSPEELARALCGEDLVACAACAPIQPEDLGAVCGEDGHCAVRGLP